jgi:hypothetical protein
MRTKIDFSTLLQRVRRVVKAALRKHHGAPSKVYRLRWRTERGRLRPSVNLDSRRDLFDFMDGL